MRIAVADEYFVGRDGGDEFIAVLKNVTRMQVEECLRDIREQAAKYSKEYPEMPISYAVGYAMSQDFEQSTMRGNYSVMQIKICTLIRIVPKWKRPQKKSG